MGRSGSGSTRYSGEVVARAAGYILLQEGMATSTGQHAPAFLHGESPLLQRSLESHTVFATQGRKESDTTKVTLSA